MIDISAEATEYLAAYAALGRGELAPQDYARARFRFRCAKARFARENGAPLFSVVPHRAEPADVIDLSAERKARRR